MRQLHVKSSGQDITICTNAIFDEFRKHGPLRVTIEPYVEDDEPRSVKQNRLAFLWYKHISATLGDMTANEVRGFCKLCCGVPIRREEDSVFQEKYDRIIKPMLYEQKLEIMVEPIDFPVTRDLGVKGMTRYLEAIQKYYANIGIELPTPENLYDPAMGFSKKKP